MRRWKSGSPGGLCVATPQSINTQSITSVGLVNWWQGLVNSGWSGGTVFRDLQRGSRSTLDGTLTGYSSYPDAWGVAKRGRPALQFNGSGNYVLTPASNLTYLASAFSFVAVFKTTATNTTQTVIRSTTVNVDTALTINHTGIGGAANAAGILTQDAGGGYHYFSGSKNVNDGLWHHVVGTFTVGSAAVYVDGQLDTSGSLTAPNTSSSLAWYLGRYPLSVADLFAGTMESVAVYRRALLLSEVQYLYGEWQRGYPQFMKWVPKQSSAFGAVVPPTPGSFNAAWCYNSNRIIGGGVY